MKNYNINIIFNDNENINDLMIYAISKSLKKYMNTMICNFQK